MLPWEGQPRRASPLPKYRYEQIADDLEARIESGEFLPGSKLPSRAELKAYYDVTGPVVDKSMMILRVKGLTETLAGVGVFVKER